MVANITALCSAAHHEPCLINNGSLTATLSHWQTSSHPKCLTPNCLDICHAQKPPCCLHCKKNHCGIFEIRKYILSVWVFCMSAQEKKTSTAYQWNKLTFFFTCSGPKISLENPEISWKSVGSRENFKKILLDVSEFGFLKSFFTMFR